MHEAFEKAVEFFGTTDNWREAGYLLPDGSLLDFSGACLGGSGCGKRLLDHREIFDVFDQGGTAGMLKFMALGAIRISCSPGELGFSMIDTVRPTKIQLEKLVERSYSSRKVYYDIFTSTYENVLSHQDDLSLDHFFHFLRMHTIS